MAANTPTRVLVTAIGGCGVGLQVVKALRLAKPPRPYFIVGTDLNPYTPNFQLVDCATATPPANSDRYLEALKSIVIHNSIDVLIPGSEKELLVIAESKDLFDNLGVLVLVDSLETVRMCLNKEQTSEFLSSTSFSHPLAIFRAELSCVDPTEMPLVIKPTTNAGGSRDTYVVQTREQLDFVVNLFDDRGEAFTVQEYVGRADEEYTVGVLHDLAGTYVNAIAVKRNLSHPLSQRIRVPNRSKNRSLGSELVVSSGISQGIIGRYAEVTTQCRQIAAAVGAKGPMNIQCRLVDGKVVVFEINPRFSGTTSLRAMVGYNEPDLLIRKHLYGEELLVDFPYLEAEIVRTISERFVPSDPVEIWPLA